MPFFLNVNMELRDSALHGRQAGRRVQRVAEFGKRGIRLRRDECRQTTQFRG